MNKETVLYLTRWYPSETDPMLGLFVRNHAKAAVHAGYEVTVAYAAPSGTRSGSTFSTSINTEDKLTEVIVYYRSTGILAPLIQLIAWLKSIRKAVSINGKPSLIHAHILTRAGLFARILSVYYRVPYIVTEHWSRYYPENPGYKGFLRKMVTKCVVRNARAMTVVSKRLYDSMTQAGLDFKAEILPNVVDTDMFTVSPFKREKFTFISITCFEEKSKNLRLLLDAAARLKDKGLDFEVVMVGDGVDQKLIKEHAIRLGINVVFTGTLTPADTASILKQSHCLVLSSNYETFGIVVYEAMASGVPVISTDVADLSQLIDKESGIIVPVGNVEALSNAMETVMNNFGLYDAEKIRSKVVDKCSMGAVSGIIDSLYQKVKV